MSVLFPKIPALLHGGDYNPDQWLDRPDILEEDIKMMKKAGVNTATVGVFSWSALEPQEGTSSLDGFMISWINYMKMVFILFWQRRQEPDRHGWMKNIRPFFASRKMDAEIITAADTITA